MGYSICEIDTRVIDHYFINKISATIDRRELIAIKDMLDVEKRHLRLKLKEIQGKEKRLTINKHIDHLTHVRTILLNKISAIKNKEKAIHRMDNSGSLTFKSAFYLIASEELDEETFHAIELAAHGKCTETKKPV